MNIHLVDSTLREGLQSANASVFNNDGDKAKYIDSVSELNIIDRFDIYMPGPHINMRTWSNIVGNHSDELQIYIGTADNFDIKDRELLLARKWNMLSATLLNYEVHNINSVRHIADIFEDIPLRIGIECAGEKNPKETIELLIKLGDIGSVNVVSINDSNNKMSEDWIFGFVDALQDCTRDRIPRIGLHLHNGSITALLKAKRFISNLDNIGFPEIDLDVSAYGLGDRKGILAVDDAVDNFIIKYRKEIVFYKSILKEVLSIVPEVDDNKVINNAVSHYDSSGKLRPEYM